MEKLVCGICVIAIFFSGCQSIKKPIEKTESLTQESVSEKPEIVNKEGVTKTKMLEPSEEGLATISEFKQALETGDIPLQSIPENIEFVEPSQIDVSAETIFTNIYFELDSYNISKEYHDCLKQIADYLKQHPKTYILIEGHCDERGTREYNLVLGEQRALAVRRLLIVFGISPERIYTISYGLSKPADPGHNQEAWAKNRRCEFKLGMRKNEE
mgnify:CR=1 FL=1